MADLKATLSASVGIWSDGRSGPSDKLSAIGGRPRLHRRCKSYTTHSNSDQGQAPQAILTCIACRGSVSLPALEIQGQATDDLRGIPCPRVGREKIHVVEDDTISILQHADMLSNIEQTLTLGCKASGPAAYTSQICHSCLHLGSRTGKRFACAHCG